MQIEIHLPVSVAIKKFLVAKFGGEYQTNNRDWFGMQIISLLERKSSYEPPVKSTKNDKFPEVYKIRLSVSHMDKHGIILTPYREDLLRRFIESVFRDTCFDFALMSKKLYNIDYKNSIRNFMNFYGIDDVEKSYFEALTRDFNRKRVTKEQNKTC